MTTDQDLRQAILGDAGADVRKRAEKRRRGRRRGGFARKIALKLLFLGLSLGASRYLIATEDGQATMARFQAGLLEVIETEMAARREAAMTAAAAVPAQAFAPVDTVEEAALLPGSGWLSAGNEERSAERPPVSAMPESRVAVRRMGQLSSD
ncbi:hypothetical protein [Sagittula sp.]|uniref:hypothetical protein n=1 Tax=Sagittula sp. TaxID=2038081 RepID=UPI00351578A7